MTDHSHMRGEKLDMSVQDVQQLGSPPHARGKVL